MSGEKVGPIEAILYLPSMRARAIGMGELKNIFLERKEKREGSVISRWHILQQNNHSPLVECKFFYEPVLKVNTVSVEKEGIFPFIC